MSEPQDTTTWQHIGALVGTAAAALGIGRASKRDQSEAIVDAIREMEKTLESRLIEVNTGIKLLLDRGNHTRGEQ
jgi:hypothetical protein